MGVRDVFLGSKVRIVGSVVLALGLVVGGGVAAGVLGAPTVEGVENRFGDVNQSATVVETNITVHNPNPVGVQLGGVTVDYDVVLNDVTMATGTKSGPGVDTGQSVVSLDTFLRNDRIPDWWVSHLRNDERTEMAVNARIRSGLLGMSYAATPVERTIETDLLEGINSTRTTEINVGAPVDPVAEIRRTSGRWGAVNETATEVDAEIDIHNPNSFPLTLSRLSYDVTMNDVGVGSGATTDEVVVPPGETRTVDATLRLENDRLDEWWVSHLEREQTTTLRIDFAASVDLSAFGLGTREVPLEGASHEQTFETDFFDNKDEGESEDDGDTTTDDGETTTSSDEETTTSSDEETTTTTTTTTTEEETTTDGDTTTTTDGGLL